MADDPSHSPVKKPGRAVPVDQYPPELAKLHLVDAASGLVQAGVKFVGSPELAETVQHIERRIDRYIAEQHLVFPPEQYEQGAGTGLRLDITDRIRCLPDLPAGMTPTRTGHFVFENTPSEFNPYSRESSIAHGYAAAATANIAYEAMGGSADRPFLLVNRLMMTDAIGRHIVKPENNIASYAPDPAQDSVEGLFRRNTVNVVSISQIKQDDPLTHEKEHLPLVQKLNAHYGDNTVYVIANSNHSLGSSYRHNVIHTHPSHGLNVGAVHDEVVRIGDVSFRVGHIASYSVPAPDIAVAVPHASEGYTTLKNGKVEPYELKGTSFAAPQAAAGVARLMERFVGSAENPEAALTRETVLLAVKQTARPLTVADGTLSSKLVPVSYINRRPVSSAGGNGQADFAAAWELLEKMERRVRDTEESDRTGAPMPHDLAKAYVRDRIAVPSVTLCVNEHQRNPLKVTDGHDTYPGYEYTLPVDSPCHADTILVHLHSRPLNQSTRFGNGQVFLFAPGGESIQLSPSAYAGSEGDDYLIAKVPAMQGVPLQGEWKIVSSSQIDSVTIDFPNAMQPDDVGVVVKPARRPAKELYCHADLRDVKTVDLDQRFIGDSPTLADYDFSTTAFPGYYMQARLIGLVENARDAMWHGEEGVAGQHAAYAEKLLATGYPGFSRRDALHAAIQERDPQAALAALIPPEKHIDCLVYAARCENAYVLQTLIDAGLDPRTADGNGRNVLFFVRQDSKNGEFLAKAVPGLVTLRDGEGRTAGDYWRQESTPPKMHPVNSAITIVSPEDIAAPRTPGAPPAATPPAR